MNGTLVHVFAEDPRFGNPAAVLFAADAEITDAEMQRLAQEIDSVLTIFLLPPQTADGDVRFRFFTASTEMKFCGHGILGAAACYLAATGQEEARVETAMATVTIQRSGEQSAQFRTLAAAVLDVQIDPAAAASLLGLVAESLDLALPLCVATVGSPKLLIPVQSIAVLQGLTPDLAAIREWSLDHGVNGVYAYTQETEASGSTVQARSFNPLSGVTEDVATGVAAGALARAFRQRGLLEPGAMPFVVEQGHSLGNPTTIYVDADEKETKIGGPVVEIGRIDIQRADGQRGGTPEWQIRKSRK